VEDALCVHVGEAAEKHLRPHADVSLSQGRRCRVDHQFQVGWRVLKDQHERGIRRVHVEERHYVGVAL
jgi:hypothetical protein